MFGALFALFLGISLGFATPWSSSSVLSPLMLHKEIQIVGQSPQPQGQCRGFQASRHHWIVSPCKTSGFLASACCVYLELEFINVVHELHVNRGRQFQISWQNQQRPTSLPADEIHLSGVYNLTYSVEYC
jgi:hypothetical protein